jgi:outer membrane protein
VFKGLLTLLCLLCLGITACKVDQQQEVKTYKDVSESATTKPAPYRAGEPLPLALALALANNQNEEIAQRGEDYLQAYYEKDRAFAAFLPTFDLAATYFRRQRASGFGGNEVTDVSVPGSINVFNGFSDKYRLQAAELTIDERRLALQDFQQQLLLQVAITYYQVLQAESSAKVLQQSLELQTARVRDVRAREQAGLARLLDVAQTQAQVSATQVGLIQALNAAKNGRSLLGSLIGQDIGTSPLADQLTPPQNLPTLIEFQTSAALCRMDLQAILKQIQARRQRVEVEVGRYYPSVTLNFEAFLFKQSEPTVSRWAALVEVTMPIFSAGVIEADVKTAWSEFRKSILAESNLRRRIMQDIQASLDDVNDAASAIEQLRIGENAAQLALNQSTAAYKVGLSTNLEQLIAQDQLLSAQLGINNTEYDRKQFYLILWRLSGQSIPRLIDRDGALKFEYPSTSETQPSTSQPTDAKTLEAVQAATPAPPSPGSPVPAAPPIPPPNPFSETN